MTPLADVVREGRLIRREWSRIEDGRQLLCLYTALLGDPHARPGDGSCPTSTCPQWLAHLLPWMDDAGSVEHWPTVVERVVRLAPRFGGVSPACDWRVRALCVREAMRHTDDAAVLAVCERVAALCERRGRGEPAAEAEAREAAAEADARELAAKAAAREAEAETEARAAEPAAEAAAEAAWAAWAAAAAARVAAAWATTAAREAAWAATWTRAAAWAASEAGAAAWAEARAAAAAEADRLTHAILDEIERDVAAEVAS